MSATASAVDVTCQFTGDRISLSDGQWFRVVWSRITGYNVYLFGHGKLCWCAVLSVDESTLMFLPLVYQPRLRSNPFLVNPDFGVDLPKAFECTVDDDAVALMREATSKWWRRSHPVNKEKAAASHRRSSIKRAVDAMPPRLREWRAIMYEVRSWISLNARARKEGMQ